MVDKVVEDLADAVSILVGSKDSFRLDASEDDGSQWIELNLQPEDRGKVIGRRGNTVRALRTLLAARGRIEGERYELEILDPD